MRQPLPAPWRRVVGSLLMVVLLLTIATERSSVTPVGAAAPSGDWPTYLHDPQRSAQQNDPLLAVSTAGQLTNLWSFKTGGPVAASATVVGGVVYVGSWDGYEYALDAATGALKWKTYLGITSAPNCAPPAGRCELGARRPGWRRLPGRRRRLLVRPGCQ